MEFTPAHPVPREEHYRTNGTIVRTRWNNVTKGDSTNRDHRSRFGKELKSTSEDVRTSFGGTAHSDPVGGYLDGRRPA